jgi:membrane-bound lytic murein transglycosylase D
VLEISVEELRRLNPQFRKDVIPGNFKPYALVLPSEKMYAFVEREGEILAYNRNIYHPHRTNTENYLNGVMASGSASGENIYYRVKRGDNLSTIARRNGISLAQLKSWNGLTSNRIGIGKQLVVGKKPIPATPTGKEYKRAEDTPEGSNIISSYLKEQIERVEQQRNQELTEAITNDEAPATEGSSPDPEEGRRSEAQPEENE